MMESPKRLKGRKPALTPKPETPEQALGWLVRVLREYSNDPVLQHTPSFARILSEHLSASVSEATLNRMESGNGPFPSSRLAAYELTLGLSALDLRDVKIYLDRLSGRPKGPHVPRGEIELAKVLDIGYKLGAGGPLSPSEWLDFSSWIAQSPNSFAGISRISMRDNLASALLEAFANSYERDERLLREAIIRLGPLIEPYISEEVLSRPLETFNLLESLGFMTTQSSWRTLVQSIEIIDDDAAAQTLIEPTRRRLMSMTPELSMSGVAPLADYCIEALEDRYRAFTTREESLRFLQASGAARRSGRFRRYVNEDLEDVRQLAIRPSAITRKEALDQVLASIHCEMIARKEFGRNGSTALPAGLSYMLEGAIFTEDRVERLKYGVILSHTPFADAIAVGCVKTIRMIPIQDYGIICSLIRLVTKINSPAGFDELSTLNITEGWHESIRLSMSWALGLGRSSGDENRLLMLSNASGVTSRRVIVLSAARRGFWSLVSTLAADTSDLVRREAGRQLTTSAAKQWLERIVLGETATVERAMGSTGPDTGLQHI
jgi:hypothetical protein